ncbi:gluconate permease [Klebsiella pneumoniae]|nr:gluconate permease [Klebsiella pneumoniae]
MSTSALLLIALASVVLLLLLVIKAKAHPFVALLIVSLLVAFATGIPADKIITTIEKGMGGLLGHIASIIILGSMLGVLIEMSGGAESLAKTLTGVLGAKRTIAALTIVAFILGTPVFFEVGFIIIIPLIYGFSKVAHVSPLKFGLPMAGVMLTVHVALPTHPGAAAAAGILHSDVGWLMLAGLGCQWSSVSWAILSPGLSIGAIIICRLTCWSSNKRRKYRISRLTRSRPVCRRRMRWLSVG